MRSLWWYGTLTICWLLVMVDYMFLCCVGLIKTRRDPLEQICLSKLSLSTVVIRTVLFLLSLWFLVGNDGSI